MPLQLRQLVARNPIRVLVVPPKDSKRGSSKVSDRSARSVRSKGSQRSGSSAGSFRSVVSSSRGRSGSVVSQNKPSEVLG